MDKNNIIVKFEEINSKLLEKYNIAFNYDVVDGIDISHNFKYLDFHYSEKENILKIIFKREFISSEASIFECIEETAKAGQIIKEVNKILS